MKKAAIIAFVLLFSNWAWSQEAIEDFDQGSLDSVFVDSGGGVQESSFTVSDNLQTLVFMIAFGDGDPVPQFVAPDGSILGLDASNVTVQRTDWGMTVGLSTPAIGTWKLQLLQTLGAGAYSVSSMSVPAIPTIALSAPASTQQYWVTPIKVSGSTQPGQAGKTVTIMLSTSRSNMTGMIAGTATVNADGSFSYLVDPSDFEAGEYFIVASLDQGDNPSVKVMASGSFLRPQPDPLPAVNDVVAFVEQPSTLHLSFTNPYGRRPATFRAHVLDSSGKETVLDLGSLTVASLRGFPSGAAQAWVVGVDSQGRAGSPSTRTSVAFGVTPPQMPALNLAQATIPLNLVVGQDPVSVSFALSGSFASGGAAVDYVAAQIGAVPSGVFVQCAKSQYYLPSDSGNLSLAVSVTTIVAAGSYSIPITFQSVGNSANSVTGMLQLTISYPNVAISSIDPSSLLMGETPSVSITGSGFYAGTRVFLDGSELAVDSILTQSIVVDMPGTLAAGDHVLSIKGSNGSSAATTLTVDGPNYDLLAYKTVSKALPGTVARFWLGVEPLNGYTGSTRLQLSGVPGGWSAAVDPATLSGTQTAEVDVEVPATASPGDYSMTASTSEGGRVQLNVTVMNATLDPFISSFSTYAANVADSFLIYGYGFGTAVGQITVGSQSWTISSWSDDLIRVTIPQGAQTGLLRVQLPGGRISNGITFGVKNYGFQFRAGLTSLSMQGGDKNTIAIQLTGYGQPVSLQAQSSSSLIQASLDTATITPVGLANLTIALDKNIPNGSYTVLVGGTCGSYQTGIKFTITVGSALAFAAAKLPIVFQGTDFAASLSAVNAVGAPVFSISSGTLPAGLSLDSSGLISGRASEAGLFRVVFEVTDAAGHKTDQEFKIFVEPTGWYCASRDDSRSWFSPVDSPADARTAWTSASLGSPAGLLAGFNYIYLLSSSGITALYAPTGAKLYSINGRFSSAHLMKGVIVALGTDGSLHAYDPGYGNQIWERDGVSRYWTQAGRVLADTGAGKVLLIDASLGTLNGTVQGELSGNLVDWRGKLYRLQGNVLQLWSDAQGWAKSYTYPAAALLRAFGDGKTLFLAAQDGAVLAWNGSQATQLWSGPVASAVVSNDWLAVDTGSSIEIRDRGDGHLLRTLPGGGYDELLGAKEKLFAIKDGILYSINLYTGSLIWRSAGAFSQAVLFGDQLFAVNSQGAVSEFNAPDDIAPPATTLVSIPAKADGLNGWYITAPQAGLSAIDKETYTASTSWKIDGESWTAYAGPRLLPDGVHTIVWRSVDTGGLVEADEIATVSVDSQRPITVAAFDIPALSSLPGVWGAPVNVGLTSTESVTGVAEIDYRVNDGAWQVYSKPVTFAQQGFFTLEYRGRSAAGGWEDAKRLNLTLDFSDPKAKAEERRHDDAVFVFLEGSASSVGLDRLEYRIDSGEVRTYEAAIPFTQSGEWTLYYRAVDKAGRASRWASVGIANRGPDAMDSIGRVRYALGSRGRDIDHAVGVGSRIFSNSGAAFMSLPPELVGAAYFRNLDTDGESSISDLFTVQFSGPVTVFYLKDPASSASLSGWAKGEFIPMGTLSKAYFASGLQLWSKSFAAGETAVFPGPGLKRPGGDLVFVQAMWRGLEIVSPAPDAAFRPGQTVTFQAYAGSSSPNLSWSARENGQPWKTFGSGISASYAISSKADGGGIEVKVESAGAGPRLSANGAWRILFREKLAILFPNPMSPVRANAPLTPRLLYTDEYGEAKEPLPSAWTLSKNGKALYSGAAPIQVGAAGDYSLEVSSAGRSGETLSASTKFMAVADPGWIWWRWFEKPHRRWGGEAGEGFFGQSDARDEGRDARAGKGSLPLRVWLWPKGCEYRYTLQNGNYEVRMLLGPFRAWDVHTVTLNGRAVNIQAKKDGEVYSLRFVVPVTDGFFHILGTDGLPFYQFKFRNADSAAPPSAAVEGLVDSLEDLK